MKNILLLLVFATASASAQPTLTSATSTPVIGEQFFNYICHVGGVSVGPSGTGVVWDYSSLVDSAADTVYIATCASTPYCDSLGSCSLVSIVNHRLNYHAVLCDTSGFAYSNAAYNIGSASPMYQYTDRPYQMLKYPMNYGDSWHDTCLYRVPSANEAYFLSQYHIADGTGSLITPSGSYTNVLRLHITDYYADTNTASSSVSWFRMEGYFWFTPGYHDPLLMIRTLIDSSTHATTTTRVAFSAHTPLALANVETRQPQINVYPNPANGILNFTSGLKNCTATLADITGRTVATARERFTNGNGQIDVSGLPGGMYLLQLKNDATVQTQKVVVGLRQ